MLFFYQWQQSYLYIYKIFLNLQKYFITCKILFSLFIFAKRVFLVLFVMLTVQSAFYFFFIFILFTFVYYVFTDILFLSWSVTIRILYYNLTLILSKLIFVYYTCNSESVLYIYHFYTKEMFYCNNMPVYILYTVFSRTHVLLNKDKKSWLWFCNNKSLIKTS